MRGRSACPTGQQKNFVEATAGSPLFSTRKGWVPNRPLIRPSVRTGAPSAQRTRPQSTPRRVSPPAGGERKSNHVLTGSAGQNILLTPRVPASLARVGVHPQFWEPSAAGPKIPAFPSPPSRWAGRYGRKIQGRRPVSEYRKKLSLISDQREAGPGRREPLSALVFFPPAFFQRKPGPRPGPGVLRGAAPRGNFRGTHP